MISDRYGRRDFVKIVGLGTASLGIVRDAAAGLRQPASGRRPNILFLFPDQLRHDFIEPNTEVPVRTPNLRKLSEEGVRFAGAVTPSPLCAPARACLASGKHYDRCRVASNSVNYPLDQTTLYRLLRDAGYHVMGCGKFDLHKPELDWGLDGKRLIQEWGFSDGIDSEGKRDAIRAYERVGGPTGPYMAYLERRGLAKVHLEDFRKRKGQGHTFPTPLADDDYCDNWIARNGLELLGKAPAAKPWFLQVNFNGPHEPWDVTTRMEARWRGIRFCQPNGGVEFTAEQYSAIRQNYAAMIENIDRWIGEFVAVLKRRGELENTLIIFSSDHGEMLGDHNAWGKSKPYQESVGVPLVVWGPGTVRGATCSALSTTLDLTATILEKAGIPLPSSMESRSLSPVLEGRANATREYVVSGLGSWRMVTRGRYKFIRGFGQGPLLFDLASDPAETENLVHAMPEAAEDLSRILQVECGMG